MQIQYRKTITRSLLVLALPFVLAGSASAHVTVQPNQAVTADWLTFTVSVPNERDVANTQLKLLIPAGLEHVTPTVKQGWTITTDTHEDNKEHMTAVTWSGGEIPAGFRDDFTFSAKAPDEASELQWKAYQTYQDGTVIAWDQPQTEHESESETSGPYSVTKVVATETEPAANTSQTQSGPTTTWSLAIASISAILSLVAVFFATRKPAASNSSK